MRPERPVQMLHRYPLFRTTNPDQMIYQHLAAYGALRGEIRNRDGFAAWGNLVLLPGIALGAGGSTVATRVDYSEVPQFRWQVARRGRAEISLSDVRTATTRTTAASFRPVKRITSPVGMTTIGSPLPSMRGLSSGPSRTCLA